MPEARDPPPTDEGWYALHDYRTIDWDAWRDATDRERKRALAEVTEHLDSRLAVADADAGDSALYSILGHKADILILHLRPSSAHIGALERQFEQTEFARFTERETSFVSVTEASGYSENARDYFEGELDEDSGLYNYIQTRLKPTIPDATHVCFYPMDKRRQPDQNWYDMDFEERAEHMEAHGDIGRDYGGKIIQMITGAIALDDWEWGVTLWGDDLVDMKDLLYEMRFDPSTSQFAEFGSFYIGRRIAPSDLPALMAGEVVPADGDVETDLDAAGPIHPGEATSHGADEQTHGDNESHAEHAHDDEDEHSDDGGRGGPPMGGDGESITKEADDLAGRLGKLGIREGEGYEAGDFGLVLYSDADAQELADEVDGLRENFDHYDTHGQTVVRAQSGRSAIVSIWENERAADTAEGFLTDLPGVDDGYRGSLGDGEAADEHEEHGSAGGDAGEIREELADLDVYAGQPHGEDIYALVLYSEADLDELTAEVADLSDGFDRYDTHEGTDVYDDPDSDNAAVVSRWETADAANTASEYLSDLPDIVGWADEGDGFETMGMFYTVKPDYQEEFVEKFADVGELLGEMEGHRSTALLTNVDDENDMFIASRWDSKENAMEFFRSDAFTDTVDWGREVLDDKPRHVFLA
ncbi:heme-binding protein [Halovenus sp. HT40]|uniref:heme-binding protein n=1 Tax=Halovenus sp. HT40 TaxID=3126691 RepID=UPI00300EC6FC